MGLVEGMRVVTFLGSERVDRLDKEDLVYCIDKKERLTTIQILDIEMMEGKCEVYNVKTKGKRGNIVAGGDIEVKVKNNDKDINEWRSLNNLKMGDKLLGFGNSIIVYELGVQAHNYYTVKSIDKKEVNKIYKISVEEGYNLIVNNLIIN